LRTPIATRPNLQQDGKSCPETWYNIKAKIERGFAHESRTWQQSRNNSQFQRADKHMAIATVNPATGQTIKTFEALTDAQVDQKIQKAANTFLTFRKLSFADRAKMMMKAADILEAEKEELGKIMTLEMGKTYRSAVDEAVKCAWGCRYYAENTERFLADEVIQTPASRSFVRYQPLGVILVVMPWNYPFWQVFRFIGPGLMAGNVGILKHASNVPQCALKIEDILLRAGFPEGAFQTLLIGAGKVDRILNDPRVAAATLTGSEGAGVQVGEGAAKRIKKVVLELGGSDPFIVMASADIDEAVKVGVKARTLNNGQSCIAAKRFIVADEIADKFEHAFVSQMEKLKLGDPFDEKTDVGPLANPEAVTSLHADVRKSIDAGAKLLTGGKPADLAGSFYLPTVLTNIPKDSPAYAEELFGPVASIFRVKNIDEAIRVANDTRFGLGASAWSNDKAEQERFINELEAGMVFINQMVASDPRVPFGGVKRSGIGRELSSNGVHEFTNIKTVWVK
jgi:succinate-semialdehyde dehydrogenase/glutarate-semialdehyde dehydrogenase